MKAVIVFIDKPQAQIAKSLMDGISKNEWQTTITQDIKQANQNELVFLCLGASLKQDELETLKTTTPYIVEYEKGNTGQLRDAGIKVKESIKITLQKALGIIETGISRTDSIRIHALAERAVAASEPKSAKRDKNRIRNYDK